MILKESRDLEWIQELRSRYKFTNPTLIEKSIAIGDALLVFIRFGRHS